MKLIVFLFLTIAAISSAQQNVENFLWWNKPIRDQIGLTSEQNQKIREIVRSHRDKLLDARNNVLKAEGDLQDLMNNPQVDPTQAKAIVNRVASARANSSQVFLEMSVELRSVLTIDQWRQLVRKWDDQLKNKRRDTETLP